VKKVLDRLGKDVSDLLFIPLEVVSDDLGHVAEVDWTYATEEAGLKKMNTFATYGKPAKSRYFWRRKTFQRCRDERKLTVNRAGMPSDSHTDCIDLT
jgi:hypothetical protein